VTARWFDPTTGALAPAAEAPLPGKGLRTFAPPGKNSGGDGDWLLVLSRGAERRS
jgi:hypothetical protein